MKKIVSISLIISFVLAFTASLGARAQDEAASSTPATETSTSTVETADPAATVNAPTSTPDITVVEAAPIKSDSTAPKYLREGLEKILSPDQIRYFRNIVKEGKTLFGIRKTDKEIKEAKKEDNKKEDNKKEAGKKSESELEKILTPDQIKMYERIKKIGTALWGYKKAEFKKEAKKQKRVVSAELAPCVIAAVETKDSAIIANNTSFNNDLNAAISVRTACQKEALSSVENQLKSVDACIDAFRKSAKEVSAKTAKAHKEIWKAFGDSLKVCAKNDSASTSTEAEGELLVEDGGGNITELAAVANE